MVGTGGEGDAAEPSHAAGPGCGGCAAVWHGRHQHRAVPAVGGSLPRPAGGSGQSDCLVWTGGGGAGYPWQHPVATGLLSAGESGEDSGDHSERAG